MVNVCVEWLASMHSAAQEHSTRVAVLLFVQFCFVQVTFSYCLGIEYVIGEESVFCLILLCGLHPS